jgi:hypothetical protein
MSEEILKGFYKHSNNKEEFVKNLEQAKKILLEKGDWLREWNSFDSKFGGTLHTGSKKLIQYFGQEDFGGSYIRNNEQAQIYQVMMDNTNGCAQYLSVILKGPYKREIADRLSQEFSDADFAPKHSYLAKGDRVMTSNYGIKPLWLDDVVEFNPII